MPLAAGVLMPHPPVLIPEVGHGREKESAATVEGCLSAAARIAAEKPKVILVISPHGPLFSDGLAIGGEAVLEGDLGAFGAPQVKLSQPNAGEWVNRIIYEAGRIDVPVVRIDRESARSYRTSTALDHGVLVPLYFVNRYWNEYRLIHLTYGLLSIAKLHAFGRMLRRLMEESSEPWAVIASGDLSHCLMDSGPYEYRPEGPRFDQEAVAALEKADFVRLLTLDHQLVERAGECAYRSLAILAGVLDGSALDPVMHSYEGPFGVGYGVVSFRVVGEAESRRPELEALWGEAAALRRRQEDPWVRLARSTVESYVRERTLPPVPEGLPDALRTERHGVFVSIKSPSGLRGCIGTTGPTTDSVADEIQANAVKAATEDPRFQPIEPEELEDLTITVDVLMPPEPVASEAELDPKRYGVIVASGLRRGLLLPDLEGVDTVREQVEIAMKKGGIRPEDSYTLHRFEVIRHH